MEGRRGDVAAGVVPAAAQGRRWRRASGGGGDSGEESDGSSGGVELSLRLSTGDSSGAPRAAAVVAEEEERQAAAARRRRNMTIFYGGRVCAVDVTEVQARAIISMANEEMMIMAAADSNRQQCHQRDRQLQDSGSSSCSSAAVARCARDAHVRPAAVAASLAAGSSRQGFAAVAAASVIDQAASGLSMKRSLQRFLQKRKARTAGAGGWHAQAMRH
ncbi:hypothetical protein GQ55_2G026900 [Panicum hallii var. hallii]|uniref:Protein TIFY n=1 Tax=Panicum hallii var. hallii TaxID=1504633 RepID=A0A2T7EKR3_9POAL|nr:hypothetical protein GQ55_2G026900 [Panicum hallii var. hallii]